MVNWITGCDLVSNRGSFRKGALSNHDLGSGPTQPKETIMRFYTNPSHRFYAGIDLHARTLHLCVLDGAGTVVCDRNLPCDFDTLLATLAPFRDGLVVGAECMF